MYYGKEQLDNFNNRIIKRQVYQATPNKTAN